MPNPFKIFCNAVCLIFLLVVMGCHRESKPIHKKLPKKVVNAKEKEYVEVKYTEPQLIAFFDSVGNCLLSL
jgi:predicted membrane protein